MLSWFILSLFLASFFIVFVLWRQSAAAAVSSFRQPFGQGGVGGHSHLCRAIVTARTTSKHTHTRHALQTWAPSYHSSRGERGTHASARAEGLCLLHTRAVAHSLPCLSDATLPCPLSLFWSQEMEIAVLGLGNAGKSSFVHVINVSRATITQHA